MPVIPPAPRENKSDFMQRCISVERGHGKPQDQAWQICNTIWNENKK